MLDQHSILAPIQAPLTHSKLARWLSTLEWILELYSAQMQVSSDSLKLEASPESDAAQKVIGSLANDCFLLIQTIKRSKNYIADLEDNNLEKGGANE